MVANPNWVNDGKHRQEMQRALTVSSAGSFLLQTTINRVITSIVLRHMGVTSQLQHKSGTGNAAYVNRRSERTPAGQWLNDTTEPGIVASTYAQATFTYRTYVSRGQVTRKLQATGRAYTDVLAQEMMSTLEDHMNGLENGYVVGDSGAVATQVNGLLTLINAVSGQVVANTTADTGDALALQKLDKAIDLCRGEDADKVIFGSQLGTRLVNAALQAQQQFNDKVEIEAGFRVRSYDTIPIVKSTEIPDDMTWDGSASYITALTGESTNPTTALIIVNKRHVWIEDLTPTSVLPLARTSSQFDNFDVFTDTALVLHNTKGATILGGLTGEA